MSLYPQNIFRVVTLPQSSYNCTDCLSLIQKLRSTAVDRSPTAIITQDIKKMAAVSAVTLSFIHVNRCCNEIAHVLAKSADQLSESVWFHVPPELIWPCLCNDRLSE